MKRLTSTLVIIGVLALAARAQVPELEKMDLVLKSIPNGPVAFVNGRAIHAEEFRDLYKGEIVRLAQLSGGKSPDDRLRVATALSALRLLIERQILLEEAERRQIAVGNSELESEWAKWVERFQGGIKREDGAAVTEADVLKAAGTTREDALAELREALVIERVRKTIVGEGNVSVSDAEVKDWYETNRDRMKRSPSCHLKQIFVAKPRGRAATEAKVAEARQRIDNALKRIRSGQSFENVAKEVTEHPQSIKDSGGDIGTGPVAQLPKELQDALHTMQPGGLSDVIDTEAGFYIMKLVEFHPGEDVSFEESSDDIRGMLQAAKGKDVVRQFCAKATQKEDSIQVLLDLEKQLVTRPELLEQFLAEFTTDATAEPGAQ